MTDYEDLTFLDPDAVPASRFDLASIKSRGRRQTMTRRIAAVAPAVLAVAAIAVAVTVVPGAHGGGSAQLVPATQSPSGPVTPPSTGSDGSASDVTNLQVPDGVPAQLIAAYRSVRGLPAGQITSFAPDSLYYAHVRGTDTDWALGRVVAADGASSQTRLSLKDGDDQAVFHRTSNGPWQVALVGIPAICPGLVPDAVLLAWDMQVNTTGCAGDPVRFELLEGTDSTLATVNLSTAYVTEEGSLLLPQGLDTDNVELTISAGEEPFIIKVDDWRSAWTTSAGVTTAGSCRPIPTTARVDGQVVPPLASYGVELSCDFGPTGADLTSVTVTYAPGGVVLGEWTASR